MKIRYSIFFFILCTLMAGSVQAKSGVAAIIENDMKNSGEWDESDSDYTYDSNVNANWINIDLSFANMKAAMENSLGVPESNYIILILFSLAALLQMARVASGGGEWVGFTVRLIVILGFLKCYSSLFDGVQLFFAYLADNILSGQTAYESFWSKQQMVWEVLMNAINQSSAVDMLKNGLFLGITSISAILAFAIYILIFIAQSCIIITLRYLGPILISLAIIPETDFTPGYITTTFQTFAWSIMAAILIKIMGTTTDIGTLLQLNMRDYVAISAMNICFALAFLMIPIMTGMIFSGKGAGAAGLALLSFSGGLVKGAVKSVFGARNNKGRGHAQSGSDRGGESESRGRGSGGATPMASSSSMARRTAGASSKVKYKPQVSYQVDHIQKPSPTHKAEQNKRTEN